MEEDLDLALSTRVSEVRRLRAEMLDWLLRANVDAPTAHDVALAAVEAFSNALRHPVERGSQTIRVRGSVTTNMVTLTIDDDGSWRAPDRSRDSGGYGLGLMKALMTDMHIDRGPSGTRVSLRRELH